MLRIIIIFCVCTLFLNSASGFINQFLHSNIYPKCCKQNEVLSVVSLWQNISYECVPDVNRTTQILSGDFLPEFDSNSSLSDSISCVDVVVDEDKGIRHVIKIDGDLAVPVQDLHFFPKCCPIGSSYKTLEHKCTASIDSNNNTNNFSDFTEELLKPHLENGLFLIKPGVSDCSTVVVDYEMPIFDETLFDRANGFYVGALWTTVLYGNYCVDRVFDSENYVVRVCHSNLDVCKTSIKENDKIKCVRKCCVDGYMFKDSPKCRPDFEHGIDFGNDSKILSRNDPFAIIEGQNCRKYLAASDWDYTLDEMGNIHLYIQKSNNGTYPPNHPYGYCFEHVDLGLNQGRKLFMCFENVNNLREYQSTRISLTLSCVFLIFTLFGYGWLPEMQNLHGKSLICHCATLLVAFSALALIQYYPTFNDERPCRAIGYFIMYSFLCAFMWTNIISFDIWWTFGSMRVQGIIYKQKELRRFLYYCAYCWGVPVIMTGITFAVQHFADYMPSAMDRFIPNLGGFNCFFEENTNTPAFLVWFILPIAIISTCNIVLFVKTTTYCYRVKNEIAKMKDSHLNKKERKKILLADTERLKVAIKLFLIMGISWTFETISVLFFRLAESVPAQIVDTVFDTFNCLQGVFIFCIFILKAKFLLALKKALGFKGDLRRSSQSTTAVTHSTYASPKHKV